jgi:sRNA-binding regulator protein Hfq
MRKMENKVELSILLRQGFELTGTFEGRDFYTCPGKFKQFYVTKHGETKIIGSGRMIE